MHDRKEGVGLKEETQGKVRVDEEPLDRWVYSLSSNRVRLERRRGGRGREGGGTDGPNLVKGGRWVGGSLFRPHRSGRSNGTWDRSARRGQEERGGSRGG